MPLSPRRTPAWLLTLALASLLFMPPAAFSGPDEAAADPASRIKERIGKAVEEGVTEFRHTALSTLDVELEGGGLPNASLRAALDRAIFASELQEFVGYLASDELAGRETGTHGCRLAAEYVASQFEKAALKPVGDDQTYFQKWTYRDNDGKRACCNVVGLLEGSDPVLKDEIVVIGGHYDHLGTGSRFKFLQRMGGPKDDPIYNGADDNASGTAVVMELALAFATAPKRPRRSILFMTFSGEEKGLLGSLNYVKKPIFPLEKTVAMINLDMVGRNKPERVDILGADSSPIFEALIEAANADIGLDARPAPDIPYGGSDHMSFRQKKIPVAFFFTGEHKDYHRSTDHADKIDAVKMGKIARLAARMLWALADRAERPPFKEKKKPSRLAYGNHPRLGILPQEVYDDEAQKLGFKENEGGIEIGEVTEGLPAKKYGLKAGDVIIALDGKRMTLGNGMQELQDALVKAAKTKKLKVTVLRNGEKVDFDVEFEWPPKK